MQQGTHLPLKSRMQAQLTPVCTLCVLPQDANEQAAWPHPLVHEEHEHLGGPSGSGERVARVEGRCANGGFQNALGQLAAGQQIGLHGGVVPLCHAASLPRLVALRQLFEGLSIRRAPVVIATG